MAGGAAIKIVIDAVADGAEKGIQKANDALGKLKKKTDDATGDGKPLSFFNRLGGAARGAAEDGLGPLGDAAGVLGADLGAMSTATLAAGAAVSAAGFAVVKSIGSYMELTERVRAFRDASGMSTEESSRFVATLDDLGINAETAATSLGRFARNIDAGKLAEYNIEVERNANGTVNMVGTLGNVADAMNKVNDPTKRATMGNDLLGKSYASLTPLLQLGSKGMKEWTSSVADAQVVTDENLAQAREFSRAMDDLKEAGSNVGLAFAKEVVPALGGAAKGLADVIGAYQDWQKTQRERDPMKDMGKTAVFGIPYRKSIEDATKATDDHAQALETAKQKADLAAHEAELLKAALQREAAARKEAADRTAGYKKVLEDAIQAQMGYGNTQLQAYRANKSLQKALEELDSGTGEYTANLENAMEAGLANAAAQVEQEKQIRAAKGQTTDAKEASRLLADQYVILAKTVGDPVLRGYFLDLARGINGVRDSSGEAMTAMANFDAMVKNMGLKEVLSSFAEAGLLVPGGYSPYQFANQTGPSTAGAVPVRATGGTVTGGQATLVGEAGPELFIPQSNGRILSADDLARVKGGGQVVMINVNSPIGRPDDVIRWMREELRKLDRSTR